MTFVPTDEQKQAVQWLTHCSSQQGMEWCCKFAEHLADQYIKIHQLEQEYEAGERACIKLESAMAEIKFLRKDIAQVADQMKSEGREGMWKEALRLLTCVRAEREDMLADATQRAVSSHEDSYAT